MEQFHFRQAWPQWLLLVAAATLLLCLWSSRRRGAILSVFGIDPARIGPWLRACARRRWVRAVFLALALVFLAVAAMQPRANPEKAAFRTTGRDLAVLVDVSKSMLAEDLKPNRLERAKLQIARLAEDLRGDRIGLIGFAGSATIVCPLTSDYNYFKGELQFLDPSTASQGGTQIGRAIRKALTDLFGIADEVELLAEDEAEVGQTVVESSQKPLRETFADILLITDGENHGYSPEIAVRDAAKHGIGLYIVGIGSESGTPIPITRPDGSQDFVRYEGEIVRTRLDSKGLLELVHAAPRGGYVPAGTDNFDLVGFWRSQIAPLAGRRSEEERITWTELFQPFLLAGLFFYLIHLGIGERPARARSISLQEVTES